MVIERFSLMWVMVIERFSPVFLHININGRHG